MRRSQTLNERGHGSARPLEPDGQWNCGVVRCVLLITCESNEVIPGQTGLTVILGVSSKSGPWR